MAYELIITERAQEDTLVAVDYYDRLDPKLGDRFLEELVSAYDKIITNPQFYSFFGDDRYRLRDIKLHSFPYIVVYEVDNELVVILSVFNTHRMPLDI